MNERPMRQISLRAFRDSIADIHQPVEVSRRDGQGNIQVLGYWTPYVQHPEDGETKLGPTTLVLPVDDEGDGGFPVGSDEEFDRHPRTAPKVIKTPEEAAAATAAAIASTARPIQPVPKPSQRKRR